MNRDLHKAGILGEGPEQQRLLDRLSNMGDGDDAEGVAKEAMIALTLSDTCNSEKTWLLYALSEPKHREIVCSWFPKSVFACVVSLLKPIVIPFWGMSFDSFTQAARMIWQNELEVPNPVVDEAIQLVKRLIGSPATGGDGSPATGGEWHRNLLAR